MLSLLNSGVTIPFSPDTEIAETVPHSRNHHRPRYLAEQTAGDTLIHHSGDRGGRSRRKTSCEIQTAHSPPAVPPVGSFAWLPLTGRRPSHATPQGAVLNCPP